MKNINEQIEKLQTELDELKAIANKPKAMIDRVEHEGKYCLVNSELDVYESCEDGLIVDDKRYKHGNYYTDKALAERVAKYYRDNNMFIRKAIEFSGGYEFNDNKGNYWVEVGVENNSYDVGYVKGYEIPNVIYMTEQNAEKFKSWLEEYMPLK